MRVQLTPDEARQHGLRIIEAAEAAESDKIFLQMLTTKIGLELPRALAVIGDLRQLRDKTSDDME